MKTLFLLRHAKSSWADPSLKDFDRPLNKRGKKAAKKIGKFMAREGLRPDLVLSSSSARTRETLSRFEKGFGEKMTAVFLDELYHACPETMLELVQNTPDSHQSLMLVSHNPGMQDAAMEFLKDGNPDEIEEMEHKFPTAALAQFEFPVKIWQAVDFRAGKLVRFVKPRNL